jgi:hypothetical protein
VKGSSLWSKIRKERGFRRLLLHGYLWVALIKKWGAHARSLRVCMNQETFFPSPFLSWIEGSSNALLLSLLISLMFCLLRELCMCMHSRIRVMNILMFAYFRIGCDIGFRKSKP